MKRHGRVWLWVMFVWAPGTRDRKKKQNQQKTNSTSQSTKEQPKTRTNGRLSCTSGFQGQIIG
jgi:hypothetical protein